MTATQHATKHRYGEIDNCNDLTCLYTQIQAEVEQAQDRATLMELHKRANSLVALTYIPSWIEQCGHNAEEIRETAHREYNKTARAINRRAHQIGIAADYDEEWGEGRLQV